MKSHSNNKYDYLQKCNINDKTNIAKTLAIFGAFTEGLQLFASFAMLLNFQRFGKMKGMGQIITWSLRDETLHTISIIKLFKTFINENKQIWNKDLKTTLYNCCDTMVRHEDAFIDLAFCFKGAIRGITVHNIKTYIRFIANLRLNQLGLKKIYNVTSSPLPWLDIIVNSPEYTNFFENRVTEYSKSATHGSWVNSFNFL